MGMGMVTIVLWRVFTVLSTVDIVRVCDCDKGEGERRSRKGELNYYFVFLSMGWAVSSEGGSDGEGTLVLSGTALWT